MIPCPYCGTPNRRGSKYCSNCGQRLEAVSALACHACERLNPPGSTYCAFCGALLTSERLAAKNALEQGKQFSEETATRELESLEPTSHRELPPWLYEQPAAPSKPPGHASPVPRVATVQKAVEKQSKYLLDIHGVLPSTDAWLLSAMQRGISTLGLDLTAIENKKSESRKGCLILALVALFCSIGLVLFAPRIPLLEVKK